MTTTKAEGLQRCRISCEELNDASNRQTLFPSARLYFQSSFRAAEPRLLVAFFARPLVPAVSRHNDSPGQQGIPEWRALQYLVQPRLAGGAPLVPGRLVAPEQSVYLLAPIAQAVKGQRPCARRHVVLQAVGNIERRPGIPMQGFLVVIQTASLS